MTVLWSCKTCIHQDWQNVAKKSVNFACLPIQYVLVYFWIQSNRWTTESWPHTQFTPLYGGIDGLNDTLLTCFTVHNFQNIWLQQKLRNIRLPTALSQHSTAQTSQCASAAQPKMYFSHTRETYRWILIAENTTTSTDMCLHKNHNLKNA